MLDDVVSIKRFCVNDSYFILYIYHDHITLNYVYFLENGLEERYKKDYFVLTPEQFVSYLCYQNHLYNEDMTELYSSKW